MSDNITDGTSYEEIIYNNNTVFIEKSCHRTFLQGIWHDTILTSVNIVFLHIYI